MIQFTRVEGFALLAEERRTSSISQRMAFHALKKILFLSITTPVMKMIQEIMVDSRMMGMESVLATDKPETIHEEATWMFTVRRIKGIG